MVIEDSTNGIQAAHAAGIYCIAYQSPASTTKITDWQIISFEILKRSLLNVFQVFSRPLVAVFPNNILTSFDQVKG